VGAEWNMWRADTAAPHLHHNTDEDHVSGPLAAPNPIRCKAQIGALPVLSI
jgi:hypothetical protein